MWSIFVVVISHLRSARCGRSFQNKYLPDFLNNNCRKSLLEACNFIKKDTPTQVLFCEFCEISKSTFFIEHFWVTAFEQCLILFIFIFFSKNAKRKTSDTGKHVSKLAHELNPYNYSGVYCDISKQLAN